MEAPQNPAGVFTPEDDCTPQRRDELITILENAPAALRSAVNGLTPAQWDTKYRNWTIRQIVHHLSDSHVNSYVRFKLTLTEDHPTIKPYNEGLWAELPDSRAGDPRLSLLLFEALHARWTPLLRGLSPDQWQRTYYHPEQGKTISLTRALCSYAWHSRHHTAQILWRRQNC